VIAGAAVWVSPRVAAVVRAHPYFAVREVVVGTGRRLAASEVRDVAGIGPGMSIWDVDPRAMEARLVQHP
jgi:hypothetical protein